MPSPIFLKQLLRNMLLQSTKRSRESFSMVELNLKAEMNNRDKLMRKGKKSQNDKNWLAYKQSRNRCNNLLRSAKASFHRKQFNEHSNNPKQFYKCIKKVFPTKEKVPPPNSKNNLSLVKKFSTWFASVVTDLKQKAMPLKILFGDMMQEQNRSTRKKF